MSEPTAGSGRIRASQPRHGPLFWSGLVVGVGVVTYGIVGVWSDRADTHPAELAVWFGAAGIVHDLLLAPVFVVVAVASGRLHRWARNPVRLALAASALLTVIAWPLVRGWGRVPSDPSVLPLDYGRNLAVVVAAIWVVTAIVVAVRRRGAARDR